MAMSWSGFLGPRERYNQVSRSCGLDLLLAVAVARLEIDIRRRCRQTKSARPKLGRRREAEDD